MINLVLFVQFIKYGLLCFGGGYMIIPLLYADLVQKEAFFSPESYGNLLSISQMTPGAVSINTATYVGYLKAGFLGSIFSTIGLCFPTFILATIILNYLYKYRQKPLVIGFFKGAKWAAFLMIISAIGLFANISIFDKPIDFCSLFHSLKSGLPLDIHLNLTEVCVMVIAMFLSRKFSFAPLIFLSAIIGLGVSYL